MISNIKLWYRQKGVAGRYEEERGTKGADDEVKVVTVVIFHSPAVDNLLVATATHASCQINRVLSICAIEKLSLSGAIDVVCGG